MSPSPGSGGRGRGSFVPLQQQQQQRGQPPYGRGPGTPAGRGYAMASPGRGAGPGRGALSSPGVGGGLGKLFGGRGAEAVSFDRDKEKNLWKVGPAPGQRFSAAWLRALSGFVAWKGQQEAVAAQQQQQHGRRSVCPGPPATPPPPPPPKQQAGTEVDAGEQQQQQRQQQQEQPGRLPVTAERLGSPGRPAVTAERLPPGSSGSSSVEGAARGLEGLTLAAAAEPAEVAAAGEEEAACEGQGGGAGPGGALLAEEGSGVSRASSGGSDLGWSSVLAAAAHDSPGSGSSLGVASGGASPGTGGPGSSAAAAGSGGSDGGGEAGSEGSRHWWPLSETSLAAAQPVAVQAAPPAGPPPVRIQLSLRLERMSLTDREAGMLADWCCANAGTAAIRKLWLFDNRLGDEGAREVARILGAHPGMLEVHLSHNLLTLAGATALLQALPVDAAAAGGGAAGQPAAEELGEGSEAAGSEAGTAACKPAAAAGGAAGAERPLWLRLEWNRISLPSLMQELEALHAQQGLVVDLPAAVRADAAPSLPDLPPYLASAAAAAPAAPAAVPASRGARNALQSLVGRCHARLPWISCQYQLPSEAEVLKAARRGWQHAPPPLPPSAPAAEAGGASSAGSQAAATPGAQAAAPAAALPQQQQRSAGPLLLFPDTSALLPMLGAGAGVSLPTFFTLELLGRLVAQGRFGRALPASEQVFIVVTDSVLRQLDGLKNDPGARAAVRRFLGQGLDAYGPAGADFVSLLGAHEGEGLLVEHDAEVAGSRAAEVGTKGQRADHRIVEVALFFQQEVLREAAAASASEGSSSGEGGGSSGGAAAALSPAAFPVLLLSGDNAQVATARSHGLPAARMSDLAAAQSQIEAAVQPGGPPLGASLLRAALGGAATTGLGTAAGRSLQAQFDEAVAALAAASEALEASQRQLAAAAAAASEGEDAHVALAAVRAALADDGSGAERGQLLCALRARLAGWQELVKSHQDPSRLLRWAGSSAWRVCERRGQARSRSSSRWAREAPSAMWPADITLQVEAHLAALVAEEPGGRPGEHLAALRCVCRSWRLALELAPAHLQPLGKPAHLRSFPRAASLNYAARGGGGALRDGELVAACQQLGCHLRSLDIGGAWQLSSDALAAALHACPELRHLAADGSTLRDDVFAALLAAAQQQPDAPAAASGSASMPRPLPCGPPLRHLCSLSLRGCLYLRGALLADLATACPQLESLDLAGCGLALNLNHATAALLPRLRALQRLVLDGNGVDESAMQHIAALPSLRELSLRGSPHLTDAALQHLARHHGGTGGARVGGSGGGGGSGDAGAHSGLASLDISACPGLTDQFWLAITEMPGLTSLRLEHVTHLLQFPAMPEALPAALWRLPRLRRLSLAGSCCHPSKLKLLAATCGGSITHLDVGVGGAAHGGSPPGSPRRGGGGGGMPWAGAPRPGELPQAPGPAYRRLTSLHERDLCEAAQSFRQLHSFCAAGSALPLRVCTAFLAAAPAGRLARADLRGCCLDAKPATAAAEHSAQPPWQRQLFFSSGARRALTFDSYPAVTGTSASRLQQLHAEADSWQRPATAGRFAAALRRQAASLACLRLGGASGVTDRHLSSLRALGALTELCLAGCSSAVSPQLLADAAAGCPSLRRLSIADTQADDACLAAAAALPRLHSLSAAGCSRVGAAGIAALAGGPAARSLSWLDLSRTSADDAAAAALAGGGVDLLGLNLTGCHTLSPAGVEQLCRLPRITSLGLGRCPHAVTAVGLLQLAHALPALTWLNLSEAAALSAAGLAAALPLLPCLAHLDLTAGKLSDEELVRLLGASGSSNSGGGGGSGGGSSAGGSGSACCSPPPAPLTPASLHMPQGSTSPTGSPFKRHGGMSAGAAAAPL